MNGRAPLSLPDRVRPDTVWHDSRAGKLQIALGPNLSRGWSVWALYKGTHDLAPVTRPFRDRDDARKYANQVWRIY